MFYLVRFDHETGLASILSHGISKDGLFRKLDCQLSHEEVKLIEVEDVLGKDALDRVRTAFPSIGTDATGALPGYAGQLDQMPGSANGGVPDKVHYSGASNLVVRVNLISR